MYSKHTHINMQTYKCSTHQSYPYSAFLASERRRERDRALSLCLQIPLPNSPLKGARCPTKKKKSGGNTTSTTRDPSPRLLIQTRSITCTRSTTETKATPTSCKRDARRTFAARRISVRICVAEICLPKCTHVLTVFLSTFALTRTLSLSLSLSLSLKSAAHPTTGTVHGGELLARNQREVLRARGRTLREDEDEVEEKKEGGEGGGFG